MTAARASIIRASVSGLVLAMTVLAILHLAPCPVALADPAAASTSFTVNEVDKSGTTVRVGTWTYDSANKTLTGAPFVQALTSADYQGTPLPYVPFSGTDAMPAIKLAAATKGFYLDDLAAWVAAQNGIPLGGDTQFNVICQDTVPAYYWSTPLTLSGADSGRYWYPSYSISSSVDTATFDNSTRVPRKALLAILGYSVRRSQASPANPATYADLLSALNHIASQNDDSGSLTFYMGQKPDDCTERNLGDLQAKWIQALTFTPAYLTITPKVAGGTATIVTDDGYLKATAGEPVSFTLGNVSGGLRVGSVVVQDSRGATQTVTDSNGVYSFAMPASATTINVYLVTANATSLSAASIVIPAQTYTGSPIRPKLTVTCGGARLAQGTDYAVTYAKNTLLGSATATITGVGAYTGTRSTTFLIIPGKASLLAAKPRHHAATVTWKKNGGGVSGYRIAYRRAGTSAFKDAGTSKGLSKVVRGLRSGATYGFKVRAYKIIAGKARYGSWSRVARATIR